MSASAEDLQGNGGIGRYLLLPGSNGRAKAIAERFSDVQVREHPRGHDLYIGTIAREGRTIDVGSISTGMGCPSLDIIVNELFHLGGRRFLRVGTCGSLQPKWLRAGSLVVATAAVRDEATSRNYVPVEVPAVASLDMLWAARTAVEAASLTERAHFGVVHCKDSLFAREFGAGPMAHANAEYMRMLEEAGTLASEMESSQLFTLASLFDRQLRQHGDTNDPTHRVHAGAVLAVIGDDAAFGAKDVAAKTVDAAIDLALEAVIALASREMGGG